MKVPYKISIGLNVDDQFQLLYGSLDPRAASGVVAPLSSLYHRNDGTLFQKTGAANTAWTWLDSRASNCVNDSTVVGTTVADAMNTIWNQLSNMMKPVQNLDVDDGQTGVVDSFDMSLAHSVQWDYVVQQENSVRCGTMKAAWNDLGQIEYYEDAIHDVGGNTGACLLSAIITGTTVQFNATITVGGGDNWAIRATRELLM